MLIFLPYCHFWRKRLFVYGHNGILFLLECLLGPRRRSFFYFFFCDKDKRERLCSIGDDDHSSCHTWSVFYEVEIAPKKRLSSWKHGRFEEKLFGLRLLTYFCFHFLKDGARLEPSTNRSV